MIEIGDKQTKLEIVLLTLLLISYFLPWIHIASNGTEVYLDGFGHGKLIEQISIFGTNATFVILFSWDLGIINVIGFLATLILMGLNIIALLRAEEKIIKMLPTEKRENIEMLLLILILIVGLTYPTLLFGRFGNIIVPYDEGYLQVPLSGASGSNTTNRNITERSRPIWEIFGIGFYIYLSTVSLLILLRFYRDIKRRKNMVFIAE